MSSPTPELIANKAEAARRRAARSRLIATSAAVGAVLLFGVLVGQSFLSPGPNKPANEPPLEKHAIISGSFSNFAGIDKNNKPFTVKALEGVQDAKVETLMHLKTVVGNFVRRDGGDVELTADQADYEIKDKDLHVAGNVRFEEPGRYVAHLKTASVNLEKQVIVTKEPVQVETSGATVLADSMETSDDGKVVILRGNVKAHFTTGVEQ